ncbi:MAG TPA: TetR family transcriptional regulator C-terminal domain-containing protein [Solirubrobacteraceae bacterium]
MPKRSATAVAGTRAEVLERAVLDASVQGLEGLTIGRLADQLEMSKSGLFGLFGNKQSLQLATMSAAMDDFRREVWEPVQEVEPGLRRLLALSDRWLGYHERESLPGGCFMTTAMVEFDARPGAVHDAVAEVVRRWLSLLEHEAARAIEAGELPSGTDPRQVAFELNSLASGASCNYTLTKDPAVFELAREAMRRALAR